MDQSAIVQHLLQRLPPLLAVYAFGSRIQDTARPDSDLDLAVLVAGLDSARAALLDDIQRRGSIYGR